MSDDTAATETVEAPAASESNDSQNTEISWRDSLSEDIRGDATLARYKDVESLAAAHINLRSHMGRDKISKPQTEDDWQEVYNFLGRPESAEAYEVALPDDAPDAIKAQFSEAKLNDFKAKAHALGLNQNQVAELVKWQAEGLVADFGGQAEAHEKAMADAEAALKEKWGRAYDQNLGYANKAFEKFGGDALVEVMESSGLGNNPAVLEAFANIAKATMPDSDLAGPVGAAGAALTPDEAKAQAAEIMSNPAYMDKRHPEHNALVRKVGKLFEAAYG